MDKNNSQKNNREQPRREKSQMHHFRHSQIRRSPIKKTETFIAKELKPGGTNEKRFARSRPQHKTRSSHLMPPIRPRSEDIIPPLSEGVIRIIPLGGVEEIGKNMPLVEYGDDIIVLDAGFQFKEEATPGIDYILPNTKYLEERKHKIRALVITHGPLDHMGGIPYIMDRMGNPPLYTRNLTAIMINKRQQEFPHLPPLDIKIVEKDD